MKIPNFLKTFIEAVKWICSMLQHINEGIAAIESKQIAKEPSLIAELETVVVSFSTLI